MRRALRAAGLALPLLALTGLVFGADVAGLARSAGQAVKLARRAGRFSSLTGAWSGAYSYPYPWRGVTSVPFNARIEETGETFTGDTDEPNTFAHPSAPRLFAKLSGTRKGLDVGFVKQMDGTGGAFHAIHYAGAADPDLTRIDGRWTIPGAWSGAFFMERAGVGAEAGAQRAASEDT